MGRNEDDFSYPNGFERAKAVRQLQERELRSQLEADERQSDPQVEVGSNDLHSGIGQVCPRCGRTIRAGQATRRSVTGRYQHDSC